MDSKYLALVVVRSKFVPVLASFAEEVYSPDDPFDLFADLLGPPWHGPEESARQGAESGNLPCPIANKCAPHVRHRDFPNNRAFHHEQAEFSSPHRAVECTA